MKIALSMLMALIFLGGCATWQGIKEDTTDGYNWTRDKVGQGVDWVKEKTE